MKKAKILLVMLMAIAVLSSAAVSVAAEEEKNIADTAEMTATTSFGGFEPEKAVDGDMNTSWAPEWENTPKLTMTFPNEVTVGKMVIYSRAKGNDAGSDVITSLDIYFDDVVIKTYDEFPQDANENPVILTFDPPKKVTDIIFDITEGIANPGFSEIQIFEASSGGNNNTDNNTNNNTGNNNETVPETGDAGMIISLLLAGVSLYGSHKLKKK